MLKEINRIARQMLFLHGHLTRPADWAENLADRTSENGGHSVKTRGRRAAKLTVATATGLVVTQRLIVGQWR